MRSIARGSLRFFRSVVNRMDGTTPDTHRSRQRHHARHAPQQAETPHTAEALASSTHDDNDRDEDAGPIGGRRGEGAKVRTRLRSTREGGGTHTTPNDRTITPRGDSPGEPHPRVAVWASQHQPIRNY